MDDDFIGLEEYDILDPDIEIEDEGSDDSSLSKKQKLTEFESFGSSFGYDEEKIDDEGLDYFINLSKREKERDDEDSDSDSNSLSKKQKLTDEDNQPEFEDFESLGPSFNMDDVSFSEVLDCDENNVREKDSNTITFPIPVIYGANFDKSIIDWINETFKSEEKKDMAKCMLTRWVYLITWQQ